MEVGSRSARHLLTWSRDVPKQAEVHEAERRGKAEVAAARQRAAEARERHSEDLKNAQVSSTSSTRRLRHLLCNSHDLTFWS